MHDARPLFLALALEAAPLGVVRLARAPRRRSAYVTALVAETCERERTWTIPGSTDSAGAPHREN